MHLFFSTSIYYATAVYSLFEIYACRLIKAVQFTPESGNQLNRLKPSIPNADDAKTATEGSHVQEDGSWTAGLTVNGYVFSGHIDGMQDVRNQIQEGLVRLSQLRDSEVVLHAMDRTRSRERQQYEQRNVNFTKAELMKHKSKSKSRANTASSKSPVRGGGGSGGGGGGGGGAGGGGGGGGGGGTSSGYYPGGDAEEFESESVAAGSQGGSLAGSGSMKSFLDMFSVNLGDEQQQPASLYSRRSQESASRSSQRSRGGDQGKRSDDASHASTDSTVPPPLSTLVQRNPFCLVQYHRFVILVWLLCCCY